MVTSQEIIERSIFTSLLRVAKDVYGLTLNPADYVNEPNDNKFETDKKAIIQSKGYYVELFGAGNNQSKGMKTIPRISVVTQGFIPGEVGIQSAMIEDIVGGFKLSEFPNETINQYIDIHLEANLQEHIRILHMIMFQALPKRGYIVPYGSPRPFSGNIFIEAVTFGDFPDEQNGVIHKIYTYSIKDAIIEPITEIDTISAINQIDVDIEDKDDNQLDSINITS